LQPDQLPKNNKRREVAMTVTFIPLSSTHHNRNADRVAAVSFLPASIRWTIEIDKATKQFKLEQAVRKATAQLRRSVKALDPLEDDLYSPISGRHVSPSSGRFFAGRISRCHQRI
jgi:hypothetical protein